ncbi:MAG: carbohydrate kinase [Verrucomicrobiaceae bacterium]|nr:carbohydrate kinase [Verrucomicrobiaceae bacterium]
MSPRGDAGIDLLGLGMSVLDSIHLVDAFPSGAGVSRILASSMMGGGPVPTALCTASRLGARTAIADRIGDDWRGDRVHAEYERFGVATSFLRREPGKSTTLGAVLVRAGDGERHLLFDEGDFTPLPSSELPRDILATVPILHLNGRHWPACLDAARLVREGAGRVSFDGGARRFQRRHLELLPLVDILIVAADYALHLAESPSREDQFAALARWDAEIVGITDGAAGSWFRLRDGGRFHQPAFPVDKVIDTTGCGDVFHGAFLFSFRRGDSPRGAARFASAAAAINATALGGRGHLPTLAEVTELLHLPVARSEDRV